MQKDPKKAVPPTHIPAEEASASILRLSLTLRHNQPGLGSCAAFDPIEGFFPSGPALCFVRTENLLGDGQAKKDRLPCGPVKLRRVLPLLRSL